MKTGKTKPSKREDVRMYYLQQSDRITKLEEQRLTLTNIVITINVVSLTFGFSDIDNLNAVNGLGLPIVMIVSNLFAVSYIIRSAKLIKRHHGLAYAALEVIANDLHKRDNLKEWPTGWSRKRIQYLLHILLAFTAVIPMMLYIKKLL